MEQWDQPGVGTKTHRKSILLPVQSHNPVHSLARTRTTHSILSCCTCSTASARRSRRQRRWRTEGDLAEFDTILTRSWPETHLALSNRQQGSIGCSRTSSKLVTGCCVNCRKGHRRFSNFDDKSTVVVCLFVVYSSLGKSHAVYECRTVLTVCSLSPYPFPPLRPSRPRLTQLRSTTAPPLSPSPAPPAPLLPHR